MTSHLLANARAHIEAQLLNTDHFLGSLCGASGKRAFTGTLGALGIALGATLAGHTAWPLSQALLPQAVLAMTFTPLAEAAQLRAFLAAGGPKMDRTQLQKQTQNTIHFASRLANLLVSSLHI